MNELVTYAPRPSMEPKRPTPIKPRQPMTASFVATCIVQPGPICGRRLRILVEHLGQHVCCRHCRGTFVARDGSEGQAEVSDESSTVVQRAERLLGLL